MPPSASASDDQSTLISTNRVDNDPDSATLSPGCDELLSSTCGEDDFDEDDYDSDSSSFRQRRAERRRRRRAKQIMRIVAFAVANLIALCAGSNMVFSIYGPLFQSRLHYTQLQVNGTASACSMALYIPISVLGFICDRYGARPLAFTSAILFFVGYGLAAGIYRNIDSQYLGGYHGPRLGDKTYPLMVFAFVLIGAGTCAGYISSVSTVAKNFGKGKHRGLALASPITCFGLSGMWLSQAATHFFYEQLPDGSKGDVSVFRFFIFLGLLLFAVGILGTFTLHIVDEDELIEEAIEELGQSGILDGTSLLGRSQTSYGAVDPTTSGEGDNDSIFDPTKDDDAKWKKNWVLNAETRRFLSDHTMWPFALAFLLMIGPGEAFINNLGTVLGTLTSPETQSILGHKPSAATHVSIFGITSTLARLFIGTMSDLVAPQPQTQHFQAAPARPTSPLGRITISRVAFNLFSGVIMAVGLIFLASGAVQNHAERFWVVSALVGAGYGSIFSLTPLIVTIIWGVENFATNFGIIATVPAIGSVVWGSIFSAVYEAGARAMQASPDNDDTFCYGIQCYSATFWAEGISCLVSCVLLYWAWKGKGGWQQRGIVI